MTKDEIKNRIVAEYRKYAKSDLDWAEIAAAKIYAALNQSVSQVEQIRSFRLKCRHTQPVLETAYTRQSTKLLIKEIMLAWKLS